MKIKFLNSCCLSIMIVAGGAMAQPAPKPDSAARQAEPGVRTPPMRAAEPLQRALVVGVAHYPDEIVKAIFVVAQEPDRLHSAAPLGDDRFADAYTRLEKHPETLDLLRNHPRSTKLLGRVVAKSPEKAWKMVDERRELWQAAAPVEARREGILAPPMASRTVGSEGAIEPDAERVSRADVATSPVPGPEVLLEGRDDSHREPSPQIVKESPQDAPEGFTDHRHKQDRTAVSQSGEAAAAMAEVHIGEQDEAEETKALTGRTRPDTDKTAAPQVRPADHRQTEGEPLELGRQAAAESSAYAMPIAALNPEELQAAIKSGQEHLRQAFQSVEPVLESAVEADD